MDLKGILLEIKRTLYFNKKVINENVSNEELKVQIMNLLGEYMVKHYYEKNTAKIKASNDEYVLNNSTQIKSEFNKFLLGLEQKDKTTIESRQLFDIKLAKMLNERKIGIKFMNIDRNLKISGLTLKKTSNSYMVAYRENDLSLIEKRYIIACELVNVIIQDIIPKQYRFKEKRVISFSTLDGSSTKYNNLIRSIIIDYYISEMSIKELLNDGKLQGIKDIESRLCDIYKMPRDLIEKRIETSRLNNKIKQLEGK